MPCKLCSAKSQYTCFLCEGSICKGCVFFLEKEDFQFHPKPPKFEPAAYCENCYQKKIAAPLLEYREIEEASKEVILVRKSYKGFLPILTKAKDITTVKNHPDKQKATMHLAFLAKFHGYDFIVHFDELCEKVRSHGYEKKAWKASGQFVNLDRKRFHAEPDST